MSFGIREFVSVEDKLTSGIQNAIGVCRDICQVVTYIFHMIFWQFIFCVCVLLFKCVHGTHLPLPCGNLSLIDRRQVIRTDYSQVVTEST